jgi:hypothetical protein
MKKITKILFVTLLFLISSQSCLADNTNIDESRLVEISKEIEANGKQVFDILRKVTSLDKSNYQNDSLGLLNGIEIALGEIRHFLAHEAELMHTIPLIKDKYKNQQIANRIKGITKTKDLIELHLMNLRSYYYDLKNDKNLMSLGDPMIYTQSSLNLLDEALNILKSKDGDQLGNSNQ